MKTNATQFVRRVSIFIITVMMCLAAKPASSQEEYPVDNTAGLLPPEAFAPKPPHPAGISVITTPDGFDNFDIGVDFAEPHMSTSPVNSLWFFNAFNTNGTHHTEDGHDWAVNNPPFPSTAGDPWTAYDSLGNLYYMTMKNPITGTWIAKSTDNGQTWLSPIASGVNGNDRCTMAADATGGPYSNYVYAAMSGAGSLGNFARSTDGGQTFVQTWTQARTLPSCMIAVGANVLGGNNVQGGCVYFVTSTGSSENSTYVISRSTDGGGTFQIQANLNVAGYVGTLNSVGRLVINNARTRPYPFIAADNSFGPYRGRLYLVWATNVPAGNGFRPDVFLMYSTDQGSTWSPRVQVNDNPNPQDTHQWFPAIWCDQTTGRLYIKWYDTRNDPANQMCDVYATYTDDGGQTFAPNQRITNQSFVYPSPACSPNTNCYRGDYDAIASNEITSMSVWADFRNGTYGSVTAYFPDFAMLLSQYSDTLSVTDSSNVYVKVPAVKLYSHSARFTASVSPAANFSFQFPQGDSLTSYPDSLPVRIRTNGVSPGLYTVTIQGEGPNGTPVHRREVDILVPLPGNWASQTSGTSSGLGTVKAINQTVAWMGGANGTVLRTTNGGQTWANVGGGPLGSSTVNAVEALDADVALATTVEGGISYIYKTTTGGATWSEVYAETNGFLHGIRMTDANNGYAMGDPVGGNWTILRTSDGGASWTRLTTEPVQVGSESGYNNSFAAVGNGLWFGTNASRIYRSTNGGSTWSSASTLGRASSVGLWFIDENTGYAIFANGTGSRTSNGGASWSPTSLPGSGTPLGVWGTGNYYWVSKGNNVYLSRDGGTSWDIAYEGTIGALQHLNFTTAGGFITGWVGSEVGGIANFSVLNTSMQVTEQYSDHVTSAIRVSVTNEGNIGSLNAFVGTGPGDGFQFNPATPSGQRLFEGALLLGTDSSHVSDAARDEAQVFDGDFQYLTNLDSSLSSGIMRIVTTAYNDSLAESPLGVRVEQKTITFDSAGINNILITQLDVVNARTSALAGFNIGGFFDWDVDPATAADRGSIVTDSMNIIPDVNHGDPFPIEIAEMHQGVSPNSWVGVVPLSSSLFNGRRILVSTDEVYPPHMTDGDKWRYITSNRSLNPNGDGGTAQDHAMIFGIGPYSIPVAESKRFGFAVVAGTSFQGFVDAARTAQRLWIQRLGNPIDILTVGVEEQASELPVEFALDQNYPNPFNPTTTIRFAIPEHSNVTLAIFNILGQKVAMLVNGEKEPGYFSARWDGKNSFGTGVSSGVYFYRLEASSSTGTVFTNIKKMLLLK